MTRAGELGWQRLVNGRLIKAAEEAGFEVLVTCDQNIHQQQNLRQCKLAIITLSANRWRLLRPVAARIAIEIDFAQAGQIKFIDITAL